MRHLTWITPKWPLPADDGAKQATVQLIRELTRAGTEIHLCSIVPEGTDPDPREAIQALGVQDVTRVFRRPSSKMAHLLNFVTRNACALTLSPYDTKAISTGIRKALAKHPDSIIVYDGLHSAAWDYGADGERRSFTRASVYRAHNVESDLWFRAADQERNLFKRALLRAQGRRVHRLESHVALHVSAIFPVSEIDALRFRKLAPKTPVTSIPIGIDVRGHKATELTQDTKQDIRSLLFVGKLDWAPNRDGLRRLLDRIWPQVSIARPDLELVIVGSGDSTWLAPYLGSDRGIRFVGRVDAVEPYYDDCMATVVPVFYGSGTRVKAIEASLHGRACISSALGVEGIGLRPDVSYLQAETDEDWIRLLIGITPESVEPIAAAALETVRERFDSRVVAHKFLESLPTQPETSI